MKSLVLFAAITLKVQNSQEDLSLPESSRLMSIYSPMQIHGKEAPLEARWVSHVQLFATPWTLAHQAPVSMGFSRQEYWSGLPFPSPGLSSRLRDQTCVSSISCTGRQILYHWEARWETRGKRTHPEWWHPWSLDLPNIMMLPFLGAEALML